MNETQEAALRQLFDGFSLAPPEPLKGVVLHSSGPSIEETEATYVEANRLLSEELKKGKLLQCIHITGVMKALSDPFHRSICRLASEKGKEFFVAGFVPAAFALDGASLMGWLRTHWAASWSDRLSAFSLMARQQVFVARLPAFADLHFSLLNFRYVILQTERRERRVKFVWLLDSPVLNQRLAERAAFHQESATRLDPALFRNELLHLCSPVARELLWVLRHEGELDVAQVDEATLISLRAAGFVDVSDSVKLTGEGNSFLTEWTR